ncbi:MAG: SRPBCC family protein [Roseburia sp.]|nr:SRPBCC family protein [Ruminococcus sp.]MCM1155340.1 SRPBCC family protein [Roseburia sp.]MCM1241496.1 SRPBCC family protein [Roseburia sp.]
MTVSSIKATLQSDIQTVWEVVTTVQDYTWRSDLSKTEILDNRRFVEYTKEGYATTFTITVTEPRKRWEFDMENSNMSGHWRGIFTGSGVQTEVEFTEAVTVKKIFMKPFVKGYLKKQQTLFLSDLEKELKRRQDHADK